MAWTLYRNQQFEVIPFTRFRGLLGLFFPVEVRVHGVPLKFFFFFLGTVSLAVLPTNTKVVNY